MTADPVHLVRQCVLSYLNDRSQQLSGFLDLQAYVDDYLVANMVTPYHIPTDSPCVVRAAQSDGLMYLDENWPGKKGKFVSVSTESPKVLCMDFVKQERPTILNEILPAFVELLATYACGADLVMLGTAKLWWKIEGHLVTASPWAIVASKV